MSAEAAAIEGATQVAGPRWADLRPRVLSALVLGPIMLAAVWFGAWPFELLVAAAVLVLAWEWVQLCGRATRRWPGTVLPCVLLAAMLAAALGRPLLALAALGAGSALALAVGAPPADPRPGQAPAGRLWLAAGVPYIGIGAIALIGLRGDGEAGLGNVLFVVGIVWASDIGAYAAGRLLGGPKLAPRLSPSKTWAGAAGGLGAAALAGCLVARAIAPGPVAGVVPAALALGLASQAGDLLESWIKRQRKVKDSSALIPGHGGLFDRVDGLLAAAALAGLLAGLLGAGVPLWRVAG